MYSQGSQSDWKTWKIGKAFSSQGKSQETLNRLKKSGKSNKILKKSGGIFRQLLFIIFNDI